MIFTAKVWGAIVVSGAIVIGGIGLRILSSYQPYTLDYVEEYKGKADKATKFGEKFARFLLSTDDKHKEHNRIHWEEKVGKLSEVETYTSGGFFTNSHSKAKDWETASDDKENKLKESVDELIKECKEKYEESKIDKPTSDAEKWKEVWTYCSVTGEENWPKASETKET